MKLKNIMFILIMILIFPISLQAGSCEEDKADVVNIKYSYTFYYDEFDFPYVRIKLKNYKKSYYTELYYEKINGNIIEEMITDTPTYLSVPIYSTNCNNKKISTIKIKLPRYNQYSKSKVCENNKDFKYCSETLDEYITDGAIEGKLLYFNEQENLKNEITEQEDEKILFSESEKKEEKKFFTTTNMLIISIMLILLIILVWLLYFYKYKKRRIL